MIAFVDGLLVQGGPDAVIGVADGMVGLDVLLSEKGAANLPAVGERVRLWTHLAVREDAWTLYGFPTLEERAMFRLLITVSGVGPKVALGMLSGADATTIARYLHTGDEKSLVKLPGIGKKSAARLVVELGQRIPGTMIAVDPTPPTAATGPQAEALDVLVAMGVPAVQAEALLHRTRQTNPEVIDDVQAWVRAALGGLGAPGR
jgi:Holliday junction DNA helicase RuvA